MNDLALSAIELFSGVGMLGEGLRAGLAHLGRSYRTVCHVEREAYAASVLVARMEEGSLDAAPVWSDVTTFNAATWRGKVDCVVAGFPCQDLSVAGKRAGLDGKRSGLFFEVTRIAADCGAWLMFLENVAGIASATATVMDAEEGELDERAAARVVGELADRGWNAEWITLSASDVGASHGRARWFCLAWRMDDAERSERRASCAGSIGGQQGNDGGRSEAHGRAGIAEQILADAARHVGHVLDGKSGSRRGVRETSDELGDAEHAGRNAAENSESDPQGNDCDTPWSQPNGESARSGYSELAYTRCSGQQGCELGRACACNGGGRKHMDQLANFVAYSPLAQTIKDGDKSSPPNLGERRHLNPLFASWLMGWPLTWAIAEPSASSALETELFRSKLQQRLSCLLGDPESFEEAA